MNYAPTNAELDRYIVESEEPNGERMLDAVYAFLGRFVVYPSDHSRVAHALWIVHAHLMDKWDSTPRIAFLSAEPASGKSRALEVTSLLVPRPMQAVNMSPSALFRSMGSEDGLPTILYDEIDTVFGPKTKDNNEDIRGLLNAGHRRGQKAYRSQVRGTTVGVEAIEAFSALALAGLGWLPDTILTRSIIVRMRRRHPGENVEPFRFRLHEGAGFRIRGLIEQWAANAEVSWPELPHEIQDRDADVWESLVAVADAVGGDWPTRARRAAVALVTEAKEREPSLGIRLLADLRTVFGDKDAMFSKSILMALQGLDESPWSDLKGKPLNERGLAHRLRQYGLTSGTVRVGTDTAKGYTRADLFDVWQRYLPAMSPTSVTSVTSQGNQASDVTDVSDAPPQASQESPHQTEVVTDVTDVTEFPGNGEADDLDIPACLDRRPPKVCAQCGGAEDGTLKLHQGHWLHPECTRFWKSERTDPRNSVTQFG